MQFSNHALHQKSGHGTGIGGSNGAPGTRPGVLILSLPPANEVWGKVIFLHMFVILFTGGACMVALGGMHGCSGGGCGCSWGSMCGCSQGGMHGCSQGVCMVALGGHSWDMTRYGDTINERAVRILLECILVSCSFWQTSCKIIR